MRRGTLIYLSEESPELLPTFTRGSRQYPPMMSLLRNELRDIGFAKADLLRDAFDMYHGDQMEGGRGEILVRSG